MRARGSLDDLTAFVAVANARNFRRAAEELGMSTPMLSHTIKRLEQRLEMTLLQRTSRSVCPTEAGRRLLETLTFAFDAIEHTLENIDNDQGRVTGTVRLTMTRQAYRLALRELISEFVNSNPEVVVEVRIDYALSDIVADGFDAGVRIGDRLQQDMIALKIGPDLRMAVVAAPAYLENHPLPQAPQALREHRCINYRMTPASGLYPWQFQKNGRRVDIQPAGPLIFDEPDLMLEAALEGLGVAYVLERDASRHVADGTLVRLLEDWTPAFPGFFLYYPSRQRTTPAFAAFLDMIRSRNLSRHSRLDPPETIRSASVGG